MAQRIAIPVHGDDLDAMTSVALPHSPQILLIDEETGEWEAVENPATTASSHPGAVVAKFLLQRDVKVVLGQHMGPHPAAALTRGGVAVYEGQDGISARELLSLYRAGQLSLLSEDEIIERHDQNHDHDHHHHDPHHHHGHGHHDGHGHHHH